MAVLDAHPSGVAIDKSQGLAFDMPQSAVIAFCTFCFLPAAAFADADVLSSVHLIKLSRGKWLHKDCAAWGGNKSRVS